MTATHANVTGLAARIEYVGHKLYMDSYFLSSSSFDDLHTKAVNCCGTVRPNRNRMPKNFGHKVNMKRGDLKTKVKGNLTTIVWKDKQKGNTLMNMYSPQLEGNFFGKHGKAMQLAMIQNYDRHMRFVDKSDHMIKCYSISRWTWKWTKKPVFHLLDLTILNSFIILTSRGSKLSYRQFSLTLVRALVQEAGRVPRPQTTRPRNSFHDPSTKT